MHIKQIDIVAPSCSISQDLLLKGCEIIESWGVKCHIPQDLIQQCIIHSNSDENRFNHLQNALLNPDSQVVLSAVGGAGATRLIPYLNRIPKPKIPKLLVGFSDTTALHLFFNQKWGLETLHGPGLRQLAQQTICSKSIEKLKQALFKKKQSPLKITPVNEIAKNLEQPIHAPIRGGNLMLIQASLGTFWQLDARNSILFLEEVNERAYRVDRVLQQLIQCNILENIKAIVLGDFLGGDEPNGQNYIEYILNDFAKNLKQPVFRTYGIGHGSSNYSLFFEKKLKIDPLKKIICEIQSGPERFLW